MSDDKQIEHARAEGFTIGYGQGGRVAGGALPAGVTPLVTRGNDVYGFQTRVGLGQLAVLGDAGMISNGLVCFPGFDNAAFLRQLFDRLTPRWCREGVGRWDCRRFGHISSAPSKQGLNETALRALRPDAAWAVDHHYRHLTWEQEPRTGLGQEVWAHLPVSLAAVEAGGRSTVPLHWLRLDGDRPGPACEVELQGTVSRGREAVDVHAIGRTNSRRLTWADLAEDVGRVGQAGTVEVAHTLLEVRAVLDTQGRPRCARWAQSQIVYARNSASDHYGYEIVLLSSSGVIAPRAAEEGTVSG
jgi:hypothetical protein